MDQRCGVLLTGVLAVGLAGPVAALPAAAAATVVFEVTTAEDVVDPGDGVVSLREAISAAAGVTAEEANGVEVDLPAGAYLLTRCDGTRALEDDTNDLGDLDYRGDLPLDLVGSGEDGSRSSVEQACGAASGERVLDVGLASVSLRGVALSGGDTPTAGGGMRAEGYAFLFDSEIVGNAAAGAGGGIAASGAVGVEESWISGNEAGGDGGGIVAARAVVLDSGASVGSNTSGASGGGVAAGSVTLNGSYYGVSVWGNVAAGSGGGISSPGDVHVGRDVGVRGNQAGGRGGGISASSVSLGYPEIEPDLDGPWVRDNTAGADGGGIHASVITGFGANVERNGAAGSGGGLRGAHVTLSDSRVEGNVSLVSGGGLAGDDTLTLRRTTIAGNAARLDGGGLVSGALDAVDTAITGNRAASGGGVRSSGPLLLDRVWVRANQATVASGLDISGAGPTWVRNTAIVENRSETSAGALRYPTAGGDHLLQLSTLAGEGPLLHTAGGPGPRVAGVLFAGPGTSCSLGSSLLAPDPATAPPEALGSQPSYAVDGSCNLPAGSTNGGAPITFLTDPELEYMPVWDSPTVGGVDLPPGTTLSALRSAPHWVDPPMRPIGPRADIGAREQGEPLVHPMRPLRLLDTRVAGGPLGPGGTALVQVAGAGLIPAGARGAVVNVTLVDPSASTHLTVWPADGPRPTASTVNAPAGTTIAASTMVRLSADGAIRVRNNAGAAHAVVDVVGWIMEPGAVPGGLAMTTTPPTRRVDTRSGAPLGSGETRLFDLDGGVVPEGAEAVVVNVTGVGPSAATHLTAWEAGTPRPSTSTLNLAAGATVANLAVVPLDAEGRLAIRNHAGTTHVLVDVVGYLDPVADDPAATDAGIHPLAAPRRAYDSRSDAPLVAGVVRTVDLTGGTAVPLPLHASAAVVTLTVVAPSADAHLTASAASSPAPPTSSLNVPAGVTRANATVVPLDSEGRIDLRLSSGTAHVVVDVVGYLD